MNNSTYVGIKKIIFSASCKPDQTRCWRTHLVPLLILLILLSIIYANSFSGTWVFDDDANITENIYIYLNTLDWKGIKGTFESIRGKSFDRPLAYLSFGLNYYFHGLDTWGYHLVNFIIHCLSALFLYLFIFNTLHLTRLRKKYASQAGSIALLATALWASSPIQVTAVTYIVQRMASMAALFFIMAMFFYLMGRVSPGIYRKICWFGLCVLAGLMSLATKENAVMLPVVLYMFDILLIQGVDRQKFKRHLLIVLVPLLFLAAMAFVFTNPLNILSGYANREFTLGERLLTQPRILVYYLSLMLYPIVDRFTFIYEVRLSTSLFTPWTTLPAIFFWVAWSGTALYLARKHPLVSFCLLFFLVNHIIEGSIIPLELIYEHRNYLPSMTIYLLLSLGIMAVFKELGRKKSVHGLFALLVCTFLVVQGHSVILRNDLFAHPLILWSDNAEKSPGLSRVHTNLGRAYDGLGMHEKARQSYINAIEADRFHRHSLRAVPLLNLGNLYLRDGDIYKALELYDQSLAINPKQWQAMQGMTSALLIRGDIESAEAAIKQALTLFPGNHALWNLYVIVLLKQSEYKLAIEQSQDIRTYSPGSNLPLKVLGEAHYRLGEHDLAGQYWQEYSNMHPRDMETLLALARQAYLLNDQEQLGRIAIRIMALKGARSWDEVFQELTSPARMAPLVFSDDPWSIIPMIRKGLEYEAQKLRYPDEKIASQG
jgi:protein O-mannosyl-transferase